MDVPNFDIIGSAALNRPTGGGLLAAFDPAYQADQAKAALLQNQLKQQQLFSGGLPTDASGSTDWNAAYQKAMSAGAYDLANNLVSTGIRMRSLNDGSTFDNPTGAGGAATGQGGGLLSQYLSAAGGGMIAPGAGGDNYGRPAAAPQSGTGTSNSRGGNPTMGANPEVVSFIASTAQSLGISPTSAMRVAASEGLRGFDPSGSSNPGDGNSSFGPFQLHYGGMASGGNSVAGLGDDFTAATGLDARDPSTWKQQVVFALQHAAKSGWGAFHGARALNMGAWDGIGGAGTQVAGQGQASAPTGGQGGGQPAPISFNGPSASAPPTGASSDASPPSPDGTASTYAPLAGMSRVLASGKPITDGQVGMARGFVNATQNADPRTLTPDQNRAITAALDVVTRYETEQATPPAPASTGAPAPDGDTSRSNVHPYAMGAGGAPLATNSGQNAGGASVAPAAPGMPAAPQPISFGGPDAGGTPTAPSTAPTLRAPQLGTVQAGGLQGGAPTVGGAPTAPSGPDIPGLPNGYQQPGGGQVYVNAVLGKAAQFAAAGDPRAKVWEDHANRIQAQLTAAQAFKNNLALAQARADDRYNAANSPGAIAAAGAKAGAETTARNALSLVPSVQSDGSTIMIPQSDALAAAQGGKPIVSAQPGYVTQGQGNLLAKLSTGSQAYQERQVASQRLDALSSLLETYQTGANSTAFNEAAAQAKSLGISIPTSATLNPAAMQEFTKDGYANVLSSMKEQGNKQYAAEVQAAVNSNPNPDLQPEANAAMIAQMQGTKRWYDQNFRDYSAWYHGNKGASDDADFQTSWTDAHPLGAYVAAAGKDIAPIGIQQPAPGKLVDGQAYQTAGGKMRWNASAGRMVPFGGPTAPSLPGQAAQGAGQNQSQGRSQGQNGSSPPVSGARQARDGNWYVPNPSQPGKYLMVTR